MKVNTQNLIDAFGYNDIQPWDIPKPELPTFNHIFELSLAVKDKSILDILRDAQNLSDGKSIEILPINGKNCDIVISILSGKEDLQHSRLIGIARILYVAFLYTVAEDQLKASAIHKQIRDYNAIDGVLPMDSGKDESRLHIACAMASGSAADYEKLLYSPLQDALTFVYANEEYSNFCSMKMEAARLDAELKQDAQKMMGG